MKRFVLNLEQLKGPFTREECVLLAELFGNDANGPRDNETEMLRQFAIAPERAVPHATAHDYMRWELTALVVETARRGFVLDTLDTTKAEFRKRVIAALVAHDEHTHGSWYYGGADANNLSQ